jgi:hypothetical protein
VSYLEGVKDGYWGELKRWEAAAEWVRDDWPQIDTGHNSVCVCRLEDGQGEHRLFEAPTLLEAVEKAMNAPPFTGEKMEDMRSRQRLRIAELEEFVRLVRDSYDGEHSEGKCLSAICLQFGAIWFVGGQMAKQDAENRKVVDNPCRDLQVGPAYRMTEGDDPFSTQPIVRIIEIKRGYVLYTFLDANLKAYGGEPKSRKCSVFTELYVPL